LWGPGTVTPHAPVRRTDAARAIIEACTLLIHPGRVDPRARPAR
jgi:hypothetical protein